jgi:hypothetical protein
MVAHFLEPFSSPVEGARTPVRQCVYFILSMDAIPTPTLFFSVAQYLQHGPRAMCQGFAQ